MTRKMNSKKFLSDNRIKKKLQDVTIADFTDKVNKIILKLLNLLKKENAGRKYKKNIENYQH